MRRPILLLLLLAFLIPACGGRVPSHAKTADIAKHYFKKYGKKFKESPFALSPVTDAEAKQVDELQKNIATAFVLLKLADGSEVPVIMTLIRKEPLGWRTSSWE